MTATLDEEATTPTVPARLDAEAAADPLTSADVDAIDDPDTTDDDHRSPVTTALGMIGPAARLVVWVYVYLIALLGGWVLLASVVAGWNPVVITSGSMEPQISAGDVLLVSDHPDELVAQHAVITFEREGELIAHRVFEVVPDETGRLAQYITAGDANEGPDPGRVVPQDVHGVGRLVVPVIGMPAMWAHRGDTAPLVAWAAFTVVAVGFVMISGFREISRRREERADKEPTGIATAGIRRVRGLVALMIGIQFVIDPDRFDVSGTGTGEVGVLITSVGVLIALNLISARIGRRDARTSRLFAIAELAVDTTLVVFIATATGTDGIGWVLFALPVIEAAVRFGLTGGLVHWMVVTTVTIGARIWFSDSTGSTGLLITELEEVLDQLSVLFIVVIPGAYLAEQLIGDVQRHQHATSAAVRRGVLLEQVVSSGHEINRLGGSHLTSLTEGVVALGFDVSDIVISGGDAGWRRVANHGELPEPGAVGSGLRIQDLQHRAVVIDANDDPDAAERDALSALGLVRLIAITVSDTPRGRVVLRAGRTPPSTSVDPARLDALLLLAGQAAVALQNDQLLSELTSVHDELEHQATHDALTGLPNRPRLLREVEKAVAAGKPTTLLFLDLDGFKPVNDRLGHEAGDELLKIVATRLEDVTGSSGLVARLGGDEFTVLFRGTDAVEHAPRVASQIHEAIRRPVALDMEQVHIAVSIGLAEAEPGVDGAELVRRADVAMYHAKRIVVDETPFVRWEVTLDAVEARRAQLADDLPPAIGNGGVHVQYQPILFVGSGERIIGLEALVRWTHPVYGPVSPEELIQLAEETGRRGDLHRFIVETAAHDTARLLADDPDSGLFVTVNASPAELRGPDTVANITEALAASGLPPEQMLVEISERLVDPDEEAVVATMAALRAQGVRLLLDDFGEGQTSLSFLHQLPISGIKLDRRMVVNSAHSRTEQVVVQSIIDLARRLGMTVIAEGIENDDHLAIIRAAGCTIVQGYHFHPPAPIDEIGTLLRHQPTIAAPQPAPTAPPVRTGPEVG